jgi:hypothetical protein
MSDLPEARCLCCGWEGDWDEATITVMRELYGEAFGSAAWKVVEVSSCPDCGSQKLVSLESVLEEEDADNGV